MAFNAKEYGKKYRQEHKTEIKAYLAKYREENKERLAKKRKKLIASGYFEKKRLLVKKKHRAKLIVDSKRWECTRKNIKFNLAVEDIVPLPTHCPILGIKINYFNKVISDNSPSLDRIIPSKGYVKGNVRVISALANRIKSNGTIEQLEKVLRYMKGQ